MKIKHRSVLAAGYAPLDIIVHGSQIRHAAGGTAGNVAAILAFLGWESTLVGETGSDPAARALRADLNRAGVSTRHIVEGPGATTRVVHRTGEHGHSFQFSCPTCTVKFPSSRRLTLQRADDIAADVETPGIYFFDRANPGTIRLGEHLKAHGASVVFEPAFSIDTPLSRSAFEMADVVKFSLDGGVADIASLDSPHPSQIQIATSGSDGAFYRIGSNPWSESPAFSYFSVDAAGAGDWTTACFLHASAQHPNGPVRDALTWAQAVAAVSCGSVGARGLTHLRSRESVLRSARRLTAAVPGTSRPRRPMVGELGLRKASSSGACSTCLEPQHKCQDASVQRIRWTVPAS